MATSDPFQMSVAVAIDAMREAAERPPPPTIQKIFQMVNDGVYAPPDAYDRLQDGIDFCKDAVFSEGCPPEARELLVRWAHEALDLLLSLGGAS